MTPAASASFSVASKPATTDFSICRSVRPGTTLPVQTIVLGMPAAWLKSSVSRTRSSHCRRFAGSVSPPPIEPSGAPMTVLVIETPCFLASRGQFLARAAKAAVDEPHLDVLEAGLGRRGQTPLEGQACKRHFDT